MYPRKRVCYNAPSTSTSSAARVRADYRPGTSYRRSYGGKARLYKPMNSFQRPRSEVKSLDLAVVTPSSLVDVAHVAGTGANNNFATGMTCLNLIQQGAGFYQRIGTKINIKSIEFYGDFKQTVDPTNVAYFRYMIVYDRQPNGSYPAITDILRDNDSATSFNSGVSLVNRSRFAMIRDKRCVVDAGAGLQFQVKEYCKGIS